MSLPLKAQPAPISRGQDEHAGREPTVIVQEPQGPDRQPGFSEREQGAGELSGVEDEDDAAMIRERVGRAEREVGDVAEDAVGCRVRRRIRALTTPPRRIKRGITDDHVEGPLRQRTLPHVAPHEARPLPTQALVEPRVASGLLDGAGIPLQPEAQAHLGVNEAQGDEQDAAARAEIQDSVAASDGREVRELEGPRAGLKAAMAVQQKPLAKGLHALIGQRLATGLAGLLFKGSGHDNLEIWSASTDNAGMQSARAILLTVILLASVTLGGPAFAEPLERGHFSLVAGFVVPTYLSVDGESTSAEPGPLVRLTLDRPDRDGARWGYGGGASVGSFSAGRTDEQINVFELVGVVYSELPATFGGTVRFVGLVGYRRLFADARRYDGVHGLAVNVAAKWERAIARNLIGQLEFGIIAQPVGSNGPHDVAFGPFPHIGIGFVM